jgi:NADH dehydrogenase (ubiquinone) 1 beta subcomplex subunit 8
MLSRRIASAPALRNAIPIARRTAFNQQRGAAQATSSGPDYPKLVSNKPPGHVIYGIMANI